MQQKQLQAILEHARWTSFGERHDFSSIRDYSQFRDRVPVSTYDDYVPDIERMRRGERNLLVPEFVRFFGNSSGSSDQGRSKFLPITERQIKQQQRAGAETLMRYLAWAEDRTFSSGYTLGLFPPTTMKEEGPVLVTSNPALMMTRMPLFSRPLYLPDEETRRIPDYEKKLEAIADRYLRHDIRAVSGTTCWFSLLFEKLLAAARRRGIEARTVTDLWPNLRVLIGGGVSAAPYRNVLRTLIGREFTLVDTYNATEGGLYATSDFSGEPGMLMMPHRGTFFEFVPLEDHASTSAPRVPLWAVERDRPYAIVVTTVSGLYAYKLGDIVRFPSIDPLRIEFMGRLSGCLSVTQELTTHVEIERAVAQASAKTGLATVDFAAAGEVESVRSRYLLFAEFQGEAGDAEQAAFAAAFDDGLREQNRVYREHRNVAILAPRVIPLRRGGAQRFLREWTRGNMQGKFPRILDDGQKRALWAHAQRENDNGHTNGIEVERSEDDSGPKSSR